ncbi:MAG: hypothetical protein ACYTG6_09070, partial [Planctomycetota bacterium]
MRVVSFFLLIVLLVGAAGSAPLAADDDAAARALRVRLEQTRVDLAVDEAEFGEVVDRVRIQTGINLLIDPRIEYDVRENVVVSLYVEDLALSTVLDLLQASAGEDCVWVLRGNAVVITRREYVRDALTARIYGVAALTAGRTEFVPAASGLVGRDEEVGGDDALRPFGGADELIELVKSAVQPHFWEETEGAEIWTHGESRLIVRATASVHASIERFLTHLVEMTPDAVQVDIRAVAPPDRPTELDLGGVAVSDEEAAALLAGPQAGPALCLAVRQGLQSTAFVGSRRAYVAGYEASFAGASSALDPRVASLTLGMAARVRALAGPNDGNVLLKLDVAIANPSTEREHGADTGVGIPLPGREVVRREAVLVVTPGRWHWMEGRTGGADAGRWGFLVRVRPMRSDRPPVTPPAALEVPAPTRGEEAPAIAELPIREILCEEASLDEILSYLRTVTGLNFYVTPRLREEVFDDVV